MSTDRTPPAGPTTAVTHASGPHPGQPVTRPATTAACGTCQLPIRRTRTDHWVHLADGSDDFDPPHRAQPEPATPAAPRIVRLDPAEADGSWPFGPATPAADPQADLAPGAVAQSEPASDLALGILGRALLDRDGELWPEDPDEPGYWRLPAGDASLPRASIEAAHGPVVEVLLVDPSAGRVLDAAREFSQVWAARQQEPPGTRPHEWHRVCARLVAAVDAWDGDQPAEPAPPLWGRDRREVWAAAQPAPEPDSGSGWDREAIDRIIADARAGHLPPEYVLSPEDAAQVEALRADRDDIHASIDYWFAMARDRAQERDAARAELTRAQGQVVAEHLAWQQMLDRAEAAEAQVESVRAELAEEERVSTNAPPRGTPSVTGWRGSWRGLRTAETRARFERDKALRLVHQRDTEQAAHEGELGDMRAQMSAAEAEVDRLRGELATAHRDAAADALDEAARRIRRIWTDSVDPEQCARYFDALASATRAGTRPAPGSPEPAEAGGDDA